MAFAVGLPAAHIEEHEVGGAGRQGGMHVRAICLELQSLREVLERDR